MHRADVSGARRRSARGAIPPDINVTPLVDVVLVLLIIFMVVAPRMDQDVPVDLPGIFNPDPEVETAMDPLKVSVAHVGEYYLNDQKYDLEGVITALDAEHAAEPLRRLVLRADAKLRYGDVRDILARSQKVGFPGLSLMVGERHRPGQRPVPAADANAAPSNAGVEAPEAADGAGAGEQPPSGDAGATRDDVPAARTEG